MGQNEAKSRRTPFCSLVSATFSLLLSTFTAPVESFQSTSTYTMHSTRYTTNLSLLAIPTSDRSYVRWGTDAETGKVAIQTAVRTFQRGDETVELHAQLHLGDMNYFEYYNSPEFNRPDQLVLYEMLLDESLLDDYQKVNQPLQAAPADEQLASDYGWACQANVIDYGQRFWFHADLTRQEFLREHAHDDQDTVSSTPLWKRSNSPLLVPDVALDATTALFVGPPTVLDDLTVERRIFTNLFLPGNSFATILRNLLWITVPSPECSVLLLDWSSTWESRVPKVSPVGWNMVNAVVSGDIAGFRRLVFGQVVVAGHQRRDDSLLICARNDRALDVLRVRLSSSQQKRVALLFGCNHCPDLETKLWDLGFRHIGGTTWRSVWSVPIRERANPALVASVLLSYLLIGGADWVSTILDVAASLDQGDAGAALLMAALYVVRHVLLYAGLSKFILDVDSRRGS